MDTSRAMQDLAPASLPSGTEVGAWRVLERRGRGNYGTVYRVERVGEPGSGPFALKLATHPVDPRFEREAELLSRIHHPGVPRLHAHGLWPHPAGPFPFLVMEWVEGTSLYDWGREQRPTSRQVLRVLAQVARALEATHAVGAVHRDVKGDNVLVRVGDGQAVLTDFGAGSLRGAPPLTAPPLPPGTPAYRSPEAIRFQWGYRSHPTAHYEARPADDVFALGVTAYQLVTGTYPPPPRVMDMEGSAGPETPLKPPRLHDAAVCEELDALILHMLAEHPEQRLGGGSAAAVAHALEQAMAEAGPQADLPLAGRTTPSPEAITPWLGTKGVWQEHSLDAATGHPMPYLPSTEHRPVQDEGVRTEHASAPTTLSSTGHASAHTATDNTGQTSPRTSPHHTEPASARPPAHHTEPASARPPAHHTEPASARPPAPGTSPTAPQSSPGSGRWSWLAMGAVAMSLLSAAMGWLLRPVQGDGALTQAAHQEARDGGTVALGDAAVASPVTILAPVPHLNLPPGVALQMPDRPFPGQRKPPCNRKGELEIRGGCWYELARVKAPCDEDAYDYKGACYLPSFPVQRPHTSAPATSTTP